MFGSPSWVFTPKGSLAHGCTSPSLPASSVSAAARRVPCSTADSVRTAVQGCPWVLEATKRAAPVGKDQGPSSTEPHAPAKKGSVDPTAEQTARTSRGKGRGGKPSDAPEVAEVRAPTAGRSGDGLGPADAKGARPHAAGPARGSVTYTAGKGRRGNDERGTPAQWQRPEGLQQRQQKQGEQEAAGRRPQQPGGQRQGQGHERRLDPQAQRGPKAHGAAQEHGRAQRVSGHSSDASVGHHRIDGGWDLTELKWALEATSPQFSTPSFRSGRDSTASSSSSSSSSSTSSTTAVATALMGVLTCPAALRSATAARAMAATCQEFDYHWIMQPGVAEELGRAAAAALAADAAAGGAVAGGAPTVQRAPESTRAAGLSALGEAGEPGGLLWPLQPLAVLAMAGSSGSSRQDTEAAVVAVLKAVSYTLLEHGVVRVRDAVTRLRPALLLARRQAVFPDGGAGGGGNGGKNRRDGGGGGGGGKHPVESAASMLVHNDVKLAVSRAVTVAAGRMSGWQLAATLACLGSLALPLGEGAGGAAAARAVELLQRLMPLLPAPPPAPDAHLPDVGTSGSGLATLGNAAGALGLAEDVGLVDAAPGVEAAFVDYAERASAVPKGQLPLPPALAALLLLLLPCVLPREVASMRIRQLVWAWYGALLLPPPAANATTVMAAPGTAAAAKAGVGMGVGREAGGGAGSGSELPEVAVAALLVTAGRLQLRLAGTPVEAAIVRRLFPTPEETTAAPTSPRRAGSQAPPQRGTQGGSQGDGGGDGVSPSPSLTGRQLTVLLEAVTASGVALGEEALQLALDRLGAAAAGGALPPGEVLRVLRCAAAQGYAVSRQQLQQFMGVLLERVKALQEAEAEHGPGIGVQGDTGDATRLEVSAAVREAEVLLGQLRLPWAHPDAVTGLREAMARFAASTGAHPGALLRAWSAFLRTRPPRRSLPTPSQLDAYIEEARRELLLQGGGWAGTGGESVLDRAMAFGEGQDWMEEEDWGLEDDGR